MANPYLNPVFYTLYGVEFDYSKFEHRLQMQKAIYLLQEQGVPVGTYGFRWYLHGPYSQSLQDDMHEENGQGGTELEFAEDYISRVEKLGKLIKSEDRGEYSVSQWMECIASMRYLCKNVLPRKATDKQVVEALEERKEKLQNHEINQTAYHRMEELFAV